MVRRMISRRFPAALVLALLALPAVAAQGTLGSLTGSCSMPRMRCSPARRSRSRTRRTGFSQTEVTTGIGTFTFPQLPGGTYKIAIELKGFKTQTYTTS